VKTRCAASAIRTSDESNSCAAMLLSMAAIAELLLDALVIW
jgi:hypothetical protein